MKNNYTGELIKQKAKELLLSYGLKSVSMDNIAKHSGVSKKTVYECFNNKKTIVSLMVDELIRSHEQVLKSARLSAHDVIDEISKQDDGFWLSSKGLRPSLFYELENFFPDIWVKIEEHITKIHKAIINNLHKGQEAGIYRNDIDVRFVSDLRLHQLVNLMKPNLLTSYDVSPNHLAEQLTVLYLHAITTEKGKKLFNNYLSKRLSAGTVTGKTI